MSLRTLVADHLTPTLAYAKLRAAHPAGARFLYESAVSGERWARYSILGHAPRFELRIDAPLQEGPDIANVRRDAAWSVHGELPADITLAAEGPLLERLHIERAAAGEGPARFAGGLFGYVAYDLVHAIAKVPGGSRQLWAEHYVPLARLFGGFRLVVFDNLQGTVTLLCEDAAALDETEAALAASIDFPVLPMPSRHASDSLDIDVDLDDEAYRAVVEQCREYVLAGDAFQIVPSREFSVRAELDPLLVYRAARILNPAPYMYLWEFPEGPLALVGASPETLARVDVSPEGVSKLLVRPIAGTRRRGENEAEDLALEAELRADEKERAEHVMLVDLARNDVGRVAKIGSVKVPKLFTVERGSHVMHLVSEVTGELRDDVTALAAFGAAFPAGTLTGAPKVRAMQIIRELEALPRNFYGGAVGYLLPSGDLDFAINIRTAVQRGGKLVVRAGGGVVEASEAQAEADETRNKAKAMLAAVLSVAQRR